METVSTLLWVLLGVGALAGLWVVHRMQRELRLMKRDIQDGLQRLKDDLK